MIITQTDSTRLRLAWAAAFGFLVLVPGGAVAYPYTLHWEESDPRFDGALGPSVPEGDILRLARFDRAISIAGSSQGAAECPCQEEYAWFLYVEPTPASTGFLTYEVRWSKAPYVRDQPQGERIDYSLAANVQWLAGTPTDVQVTIETAPLGRVEWNGTAQAFMFITNNTAEAHDYIGEDVITEIVATTGTRVRANSPTIVLDSLDAQTNISFELPPPRVQPPQEPTPRENQRDSPLSMHIVAVAVAIAILIRRR